MTDMAYVTVVIDGEEAILRLGNQTLRVPTSSVTLSAGRLFIEMSGDLAATLPGNLVNVMAHHPEPSIDQMANAVYGLNGDQVNALMAQESSWGSMEDSMGLVAVRAVARALRGETPGEHPAGGGLV